MKAIKKRFRGLALESWNRIKLSIKLRNVEQRNPILVYQMGKVGSSTIIETLKQLDLNVPILHLHTLDPNELKRAIRKQRQSSSHFLPSHLLTSKILISKMQRDIFPCRVITLTREPIARAISFVFEDWHKKISDALTSDGTFENEQVVSAITRILSEKNGHSDPGIWFHNELNENLNVDVFSVPYDLEKGFRIISRDSVSVLIIRVEDLNRSLVSALIEYLELENEDFQIRQKNIGKKKWYANSLSNLKTSFTISVSTANRILSSEYVEHFYAREKSSLMKKWTTTATFDFEKT